MPINKMENPSNLPPQLKSQLKTLKTQLSMKETTKIKWTYKVVILILVAPQTNVPKIMMKTIKLNLFLAQRDI